eukprot:9313701-Alexandrium_andersonii.AAC.1
MLNYSSRILPCRLRRVPEGRWPARAYPASLRPTSSGEAEEVANSFARPRLYLSVHAHARVTVHA